MKEDVGGVFMGRSQEGIGSEMKLEEEAEGGVFVGRSEEESESEEKLVTKGV